MEPITALSIVLAAVAGGIFHEIGQRAKASGSFCVGLAILVALFVYTVLPAYF